MKDHKQTPNEITDAILMAYLYGDAAEAERLQIESDPTLLARLRELGAWEAMLHTAYAAIDCPDPVELLLYQNRLLAPERASKIKQHLIRSADCTCADELAELAAINAAAPKPKFSESMWEQVRSAGKQILDAVELIELHRPVVALRGDEPQRRIIKAGDYMIVLMLTPPLTPADAWTIEGQIGANGDGDTNMQGAVKVFQGVGLVSAEEIDDLGYFTVAGITGEVVTLQISIGDLALSPLEVRL